MTKKIKKVDLSKFTLAYMNVQNYFFDYPSKEFSLNDLCAALNMSKTTANKVVQQLISEGFLNRQIIGKLWRIYCNKNSTYNFTRKISYHLNLVYELDILDYIHDIVPNFRAIILFGSYRKGDDDENSDLDIAIEIIGNHAPKIIHLGNVPRLGYRENVPVNLHIFSRNHIDLNLFSNIANGILLYGFLEVRP